MVTVCRHLLALLVGYVLDATEREKDAGRRFMELIIRVERSRIFVRNAILRHHILIEHPLAEFVTVKDILIRSFLSRRLQFSIRPFVIKRKLVKTSFLFIYMLNIVRY